MDPKRQEEERKRIMQKYGTPKREPFNPNTSRYMEYRKQEQLRKEMAEHPEKFIKPAENPVQESPKIEPIEEIPEKKSWFSKMFGR